MKQFLQRTRQNSTIMNEADDDPAEAAVGAVGPGCTPPSDGDVDPPEDSTLCGQKAAPPAATSSSSFPGEDPALLIRTLCQIDPLLVFLTKSTGQLSVPMPLLHRALPPSGGMREAKDEILSHMKILIRMGIFHLHASSSPSSSSSSVQVSSSSSTTMVRASIPDDEMEGAPPDPATPAPAVRWDDAECRVGFPPQGLLPPHQSWHGSTKTGMKRRLAALKRILRDGDNPTTRNTASQTCCPAEGQPTHEPTMRFNLKDSASDPQSPSTALPVPEEPPVADRKRCGSDPGSTHLLPGSERPEDRVEPEPDSDEQTAIRALSTLLGFGGDGCSAKRPKGAAVLLPRSSDDDNDEDGPTRILPRQVSHAGSFPAHPSVFATLPAPILDRIPPSLLRAYGIQEAAGTSLSPPRQLYRHQVDAISAALQQKHCTVCTGTGSGKSLCFWIPVLSAAYWHDHVSFVLFPTKALAQDQLSQLQSILCCGGGDDDDDDLQRRIRPAALDGDTVFSDRARIADTCNVILTNPDTLHASILPQWKTSSYRALWSRLTYVVLDECHVYEGAFGAHVQMVLSRLVRVRAAAVLQARTMGHPATAPGGAAPSSQPPSGAITFLAASATVPWPEEHFRGLCPVAENERVVVLGQPDDGSPRAEKHFLVWNPPLLHSDGSSTHRVAQVRKIRDPAETPPSVALSPMASAPDGELEERKCPPKLARPLKRRRHVRERHSLYKARSDPLGDDGVVGPQLVASPVTDLFCHRRHAADETALLFARAVSNGTRCIAFCKTRNLVEWVFERAQSALSRSAPHLASQIESYRGGYSMEERRKIENRLFNSELLGVVGTNALELGVDIGGIDLTLHCGYPSSYASLLQQAGRGGRGASRLEVPSCAVIVCFGSPLEQQLWKNPKSVLEKGALAKHSVPVTSGLVQGHLLCASEEFPLTGSHSVSAVFSGGHVPVQPDHDLFGGKELYDEAFADLPSNSHDLIAEDIALPTSGETLRVYRARASLSKAHSRVSIRSIEPVNYALIDLSHPGQGGKQDGIHDPKAILDTIPYSRIFYHAHPGAIITHRGRKLKVLSMTRPPPFSSDRFGCRRGLHLASYASPTNVKYATRPLSALQITVLNAMERVELGRTSNCHKTPGQSFISPAVESTPWAFAGCGSVSVKRSVHGYKKISLINGAELERTELSLPPMEYETFGIWFDTEASIMMPALGDRYGPGVHALSHALLAVAPIYAPGLSRSDLDCDHSYFEPTRIMLFDERAGGSGACERLWNVTFRPDSIMEAAIELLEDCSTCSSHTGYDSGCPACLHASNCMKFNMHLSRSAGATIGRRVLSRLQESKLYKDVVASLSADAGTASKKELTPRREARRKAVKRAKDLHPARERQFVVGRVSWPLDSC